MKSFFGLFAACLLVQAFAVPSWMPSLPEALQEEETEGAFQAPALASCGISRSVYDGDRIVGGRAALQGEFPWQISLQRRNSLGRYSHICGGAVLSGKYVITAAHCVDGGVASNYQVVVGGHSLSAPNSNQKAHKVARIIVHERYNANTINNDIAILVLDSVVDTSSGYVNGACLPQAGETTTGIVTASGWGALREGGSSPSILQAVDVPVVSNANCRSSYGNQIAEHMLCAGYSAGGKDACQGDSGGPLVARVGGKGVLVGVVSWGYGCARPNYPGVYTKVSSFIGWINANTAN